MNNWRNTMSDIKPSLMNALNSDDEKLQQLLTDKYISFLESKLQFPVPLEFLVDLKVYSRLSDAKRGLQRTEFVDGEDYRSGWQKGDNPLGGRPKNDIFISMDCFKLLCSLARNEEGQRAVGRILEMEKLYIRKTELAREAENKKLKIALEIEKKARRKIQKKYNKINTYNKAYKFNVRGPSFYIIVNNGDIKIGKAGVSQKENSVCINCRESMQLEAETSSIDHRLRGHRTLWPNLQVVFIVYTKHASLIETMMKLAYKYKRIHEHEIIRGVSVDEIIQTCRNILDIISMTSEKPCYHIEENITSYNNVKQSIDMVENKTEHNETKDMKSFETTHENVVVDSSLDQMTEINHIEISRIEIQKIIDELENMSMNKLKDLCRKFGIPILRNKNKLISSLGKTLKDSLCESCDNGDLNEEKIPDFDPNNLPTGITLDHNDNKDVIGFRARIYLGGNSYETVFNDRAVPMEQRFKQAWIFLQDLIKEFNLTGKVDWDSYKRRQIVRSGVCLECGIDVAPTSSLCQKCSGKCEIRKPEKHILLAVIREQKGNLSAVGRQYMKTDAAVRKWLIEYGFTRQQINERKYY